MRDPLTVGSGGSAVHASGTGRDDTGLARTVVWIALVYGLSLGRPDPGRAQPDQFGGQSRANAASDALVLAVQRGISALPPTSGQSFLYEYDPGSGVPVRSERLGPVSFRAAETVGQGVLILRVATSYFGLATSLGPIDYRLDFPDGGSSFAKLGTEIDARVGVANLTLTYGVTRRVEANFNLPIVIVDASGSQIFSANTAPGVDPTSLGFSDSIGALNRAIARGDLAIRTVPFRELGFDFNDGTHVGVGRMSMGARALVHAAGPFRLAAACDFYFPSPSQDEFAGSATASILPRAIATARLSDRLRLHVDAGYDYDFDASELRRFVWDLGLSVPLRAATFDVGMGGSTYAAPIEWTPTRARGAPSAGARRGILITALGDNQTGTSYVDVLAGVKVRLTDTLVMSGAVNVPVVDAGLQPIAGGTIALEAYF